MFSENYVQKNNENKTSKGTSWNKIPSQNSSHKKNKISFLSEIFEENIEEDIDDDTNLDFFGNLDEIVNQSFIANFYAVYRFNIALYNTSYIASTQAKFILFQNIRV